MTEQKQWEYRVQTLGSALREPKDGEVLTLLNTWGAEGWELVEASHTTGNKLLLVARRPLSDDTRRRRSYPV
jgi:hypothetical protein